MSWGFGWLVLALLVLLLLTRGETVTLQAW